MKVSGAFCNESADAQARISIEDDFNGIHGLVTFDQESSTSSLRVKGSLYGLPPGLHEIRIHEIGDTSNVCLDSGAEYNPFEVSPNLQFHTRQRNLDNKV